MPYAFEICELIECINASTVGFVRARTRRKLEMCIICYDRTFRTFAH